MGRSQKIGNQRIIEPEMVGCGQSEVIAKFFRALGDSTRIEIVEFLIKNKRATQSQIVQHLELTQSRVSEHLKCLNWCGFINVYTDGLFRIYEVKNKEIIRIIDMAKELVKKSDAEISSCLVLKKEDRK
jgi:DNA-binding transcriptional ArsR family regulator